MLFNSYGFVFAFLPIALGGFYLLGSRSPRWALGWVIAVSVFFYAWWRPVNVLILAPSILINYLLARALLRLGGDDTRQRDAALILAIGILFNVGFLGYFKYTNFIVTALDDATGADFVVAQIVLPLGISFITFQKIAFLVDVHGRRIESFSLRDYCLFVLFFPQLIAGPIVHYREVVPQFQRTPCRFQAENLAVGLSLFFVGLFKKSFLADGIAPHVTAIFQSAATGEHISMVPAWIAALGFTLQIYFDFSGYSDMAIGLGRCFGIKLPPNFDSPLKSTSIIDFWLRWHMTLTRFLTAYIYNPLLLHVTRRRLATGLPVMVGRRASPGAFVQQVAGPTLLTMLVSGLWHGAGYLFVLWGLLHGLYLVVNHAWRLLGSRLWSSRAGYARFMRPAGFALTLLCVTIAMVLFRAPTTAAALGVFKGMVGLDGLGLPGRIKQELGAFGVTLATMGVPFDATTLADIIYAAAWTVALLAIALACPNSLRLLASYEAALGVNEGPTGIWAKMGIANWRPSIAWAAAISAVALIAVRSLNGPAEFLYWQF